MRMPCALAARVALLHYFDNKLRLPFNVQMVCQQPGMNRSRLVAAVAALAVVLAIAAVAAGGREMADLGARRALLAGELLSTDDAMP